MALQVRSLTAEELTTIERQVRSRTEPTRQVERAKVIWLASQGLREPAITRDLGLSQDTVRLWLERFNASGLLGLEDRPRSGRPLTYMPEEVGAVIEAVLTKPQDLGLPFGCWTLDRLEAYLDEEKGAAIKCSRIDEVLIAEGLRWHQQATWFGERVYPASLKEGGHRRPLHGPAAQ